MWKSRIRKLYGSFEHWEAYDDTYGLAARLGFSSAKHAWSANPIVQGSLNPNDFKVVEVKFGTAILKALKGTIKSPDGTEQSIESLEATRVGDEFWPKGLQPLDFQKAAEFYYSVTEEF